MNLLNFWLSHKLLYLSGRLILRALRVGAPEMQNMWRIVVFEFVRAWITQRFALTSAVPTDSAPCCWSAWTAPTPPPLVVMMSEMSCSNCPGRERPASLRRRRRRRRVAHRPRSASAATACNACSRSTCGSRTGWPVPPASSDGNRRTGQCAVVMLEQCGFRQR